MRGLTGRRVLISGGSSGIGLAAAQRFLEEGCRVFLCGIDAAEVDRAVAGLRGLGPVTGMACDVSQEAGAAALTEAAEAALGGIDVLANNAGIAMRRPFLDIPAPEWDRIVAVNLRGMFLVAQAVARRMISADRRRGGLGGSSPLRPAQLSADRRRGGLGGSSPLRPAQLSADTRQGGLEGSSGRGGVIINMSSTNGIAGEEDYAHYNATKGGVLLLTKTMAVELGPLGIRVNALCPGYISTPLNAAIAAGLDADFESDYARTRIPLRRAGTAQEVAAAYAFLASDDASFIHGTGLVIDGGQLAVM